MSLWEGKQRSDEPTPKHRKTYRKWGDVPHIDPAGHMLQREAADLTPGQRRRFMREMTRYISTGLKVILFGAVVWVIEQARERAVRTAAVGMIGAASVGAVQVAPAVQSSPASVPHVVMAPTETETAEPPTMPEPPTETVLETVEATETVTLPPTEDPETRPRGDPDVTETAVPPGGDDSTAPPSVEPDPDPTEEERESHAPEQPETPPEPTDPGEPTRTPEPTQPPEPPETPTDTPTQQPVECVGLPDGHGVVGEVCAPPEGVDTERRWTDCVDEDRLIDVWRCLRSPDEWFA